MTNVRDKISGHLTQHAHSWTIVGVLILVILFFARNGVKAPDLTGNVVQFVVSAIGFTGGLLAIVTMASLNSTDFNKLEKFQMYLILGISISTFVTGKAVLGALGLL
jgi:hypothetical protein